MERLVNGVLADSKKSYWFEHEWQKLKSTKLEKITWDSRGLKTFGTIQRINYFHHPDFSPLLLKNHMINGLSLEHFLTDN